MYERRLRPAPARSRVRVLRHVLTVVCVATLPACNDEGTGPGEVDTPPTGRIVFEQSGDLWVIDADGAGLTNVAASPELERLSWRHSPWSPDGTRLAFMRLRDTGSEVWVVDVDGTDASLITPAGAADILPHWSPDGRLVVTRSEGGVTRVVVVGADGHGARDLAPGPGRQDEAAWSPDGSTVAFLSDRDPGANGAYSLWTVPAGGGEPRRVFEGHVQAFTWSPDGRSIALHKEIGFSGRFGVIVVSLDDLSADTLTAPSADEFVGPWSPDGQRLVATTGGTPDIVILRADGSGSTVLSPDPAPDFSPSWSPDGAWVAFVSSREGGFGWGIYRVRPDGTDLARVIPGEDPIGNAYWSPGS